MKILIVIDSFGAGGAEKSTLDLCDFFHAKNVNFEIICIDKKGVGFQHIMIERGYKIHFLRSNHFFSNVLQIAKIIKDGNFSIVNSILFRSSLRVRITKLVIKFTHVESIVSTRYSHEKKEQATNIIGFYVYYLLDFLTSNFLTDHFHAISETVKEHFVEKLKIPTQKITVVYRGRAIPTEKKNWELIGPKLKLITIGRQEVVKGQIYLFQAINILIQKGVNVELKLLGREGNYSQKLQDYIKRKELEKFIHIDGFKSDVYPDLLQADLFIFPSTFEGLGGSLIEAQSVGLPVACSDIKIFREVVIENSNAKFFKNKDAQSIADAILFFYNDKSQLKKFGNQSRINFLNKFEVNHNHTLILKLFESIQKK
jgi:glycosyltransferase involved in cell wall biosynthesis